MGIVLKFYTPAYLKANGHGEIDNKTTKKILNFQLSKKI